MLHILYLRNLNLFFSPTILKRGRKYYRNQHLTSLVKVALNHWRAKVVGSRTYDIEVELDEEGVCRCTCSCPYAESNPCKHIAAVLLALQDDDPVIGSSDTQESTANPPTTIPKSRKTLSEQVEEQLQKISHDELVAFIKELTDHDREIRNRFLARFSPAEGNANQSQYRRFIKNALAPARRRGLIYGREAASILSPINELLQKAEQHLASDIQTTIAIAQTGVEELVPALQFIDDSYGDVGNAIHWALDLLEQCSNNPLPEPLKNNFFSWCISSFEEERYEGWDFHWDIIKTAINLAEQGEDFNRISTLLDPAIKQDNDTTDDYSVSWKKSEAILLKADLLDRYGKEKQLEELLEAHRNLPDIRKRLLERAWEHGGYHKVKELASEALKQLDNRYPGLRSNWHEWLLKVAHKQEDKSEIRRQQQYLLFEKGTIEQYHELKKLFNQDEWKQTKEKIIQKLRKYGRFSYSPLLPQIYIEEQQWAALLNYVQSLGDLGTLKQYDQYLVNRYPDELFGLYADAIRKHMEQTGRQYYQECCHYLLRLHGLDGRKLCRDLIADFREQYSNRPAMLDELNQLEETLPD